MARESAHHTAAALAGLLAGHGGMRRQWQPKGDPDEYFTLDIDGIPVGRAKILRWHRDGEWVVLDECGPVEPMPSDPVPSPSFAPPDRRLSQFAPAPERELTFNDLTRANRARCGRWHPGFPDDETWTLADWSNAIGGEVGELAEALLAVTAAAGKVQNTTKKIRRYETGTNTAIDKPLEQLKAELEDEAADVMCYLDLFCVKANIDLPAAVIRKFNRVSERQDFPDRLGT